MAAVVRSRSVEETEDLGEALGRAAFPGAVLLLEGPLGAGKTALARGVAAGLGARGPVTSPSFTILAVHPGRLPLFHVDLYRVARPDELRSIDLEEIFDSGGVAVVEWPRWLLERPPGGALEVRIRIDGPEERRFELAPRDPRWEDAVGAVPASSGLESPGSDSRPSERAPGPSAAEPFPGSRPEARRAR